MSDVPSKTCLVSGTAHTVGNKSDREPVLIAFILARAGWERQTVQK